MAIYKVVRLTGVQGFQFMEILTIPKGGDYVHNDDSQMLYRR